MLEEGGLVSMPTAIIMARTTTITTTTTTRIAFTYEPRRIVVVGNLISQTISGGFRGKRKRSREESKQDFVE